MFGDSAPTIPTLLLALTSLTAGFLAASAPQEEGTLRASATLHPGGEAFQVSAQTGESIVLALAEAGPAADVAVFGPDDELRDRVTVGAQDEPVRVSISRSGPWVLVPLAEATPLDLKLESTGGDVLPAEVSSIPVREHTRSLAEQDEGRLDVDRGLLIDRRPAVAFLRADAEAANLTTSLSTAQGPVFEGEVDELDGTFGLDRLGEEATVTPRHIEAGVYAVQAHADAFDGELDLVHRTYDRTPDRGPAPNRSMEGLAELGVPVATLQPRTAVHIAAEDLTRLRFAVPGDASADVRVYNGENEVRADVEVEAQVQYDWDFPSEEPSVSQRTVSLGTDDRYTVWAESVDGVEAVHVLAPGVRTADPGQPAPIAETTLDVSFGAASNPGAEDETELEGGLVDVTVNVDAAGAERVRAQVTGPLGNIYTYEERYHANGQAVIDEEQSNPREFTDGNHTVLVEVSNAVDATVETTLFSYRTP